MGNIETLHAGDWSSQLQQLFKLGKALLLGRFMTQFTEQRGLSIGGSQFDIAGPFAAGSATDPNRIASRLAEGGSQCLFILKLSIQQHLARDLSPGHTG